MLEPEGVLVIIQSSPLIYWWGNWDLQRGAKVGSSEGRISPGLAISVKWAVWN